MNEPANSASTIGFVGLGIMGGPMAANLLAAGHTVIGYDTRPAAVEKLADAGGKGADRVGAVAAADVVITMLPDSPQVEEVILGPGGVLEHAAPGLLLIDMSTIRPDTSVMVAEAAAARGVRALDAPVSGGERGASSSSSPPARRASDRSTTRCCSRCWRTSREGL